MVNDDRTAGDGPAECDPVDAVPSDSREWTDPLELGPADLFPLDRPLTVLRPHGPCRRVEELRAGLRGVEVLAVTVRRDSGDPVPDPTSGIVEQLYGADLARILDEEKVTGEAGQTVRVPLPLRDGLPGRVLLVGTGSGSARDLRRTGAALGRACRGRQTVLTSLLDGLDDSQVRAAVEGFLLGGYTHPARGTKDRSDSAPAARALLTGEFSDRALLRGAVHAAATALARDLAVMPCDVKSPEWFAQRAVALGEATGLRVRVLRTDRLQAEGLGGILAVGGGSAAPPCLVRVDHLPDAVDHLPDGAAGPDGTGAPLVLVGKGITFDTGGLSIKPADPMSSMKTDMSGAAAVLAALVACRAADVTTPVTGLLPLAENAVGADAWRPGDVVRQHDGHTVEIRNTDAEGRIVLADALSYAVRDLGARTLVDVATLTGAATLGLGRGHAALLATDDDLAAALTQAGAEGGELVWRLPLAEEYRSSLDSPVADLCHIATDGVGGGEITAALFLREFTGSCRWAHLDIAGSARADAAKHEVCKGATGYGARLLLRWLEVLGRPGPVSV
jgi:leucyl aminopeptidase